MTPTQALDFLLSVCANAPVESLRQAQAVLRKVEEAEKVLLQAITLPKDYTGPKPG